MLGSSKLLSSPPKRYNKIHLAEPSSDGEDGTAAIFVGAFAPIMHLSVGASGKRMKMVPGHGGLHGIKGVIKVKASLVQNTTDALQI